MSIDCSFTVLISSSYLCTMLFLPSRGDGPHSLLGAIWAVLSFFAVRLCLAFGALPHRLDFALHLTPQFVPLVGWSRWHEGILLGMFKKPSFFASFSRLVTSELWRENVLFWWVTDPCFVSCLCAKGRETVRVKCNMFMGWVGWVW